LLAFDQDPAARANVAKDPRFVFVPQNFRYLRSSLLLYRVKQIDGLLADLGVSSHQFDEGTRGFSIRSEAPLDMRMNPNQGQSAREILNSWPKEELAALFKEYGEVERAGLLASRIDEERQAGHMETTGDLLRVLHKLAPPRKELKYFAQVFQALRIQVNDEMGALKDVLEQAAEVLKPGGRLVVISYHSLEDRLVKNFMRSGSFSGEVRKDFFGNTLRPFKPLQSKPISPSEEEITRNPRSRSAKMRIAIKLP
jgi:16S rRNA (cytosine1402-N4)-methyltransferase